MRHFATGSRSLTRRLAAALALTSTCLAVSAYGAAADTFHLTDEPGNWFRSETTGSPLAVVDPGDRIDFKINKCCTSTRHTVTLLVKPEGSATEIDQDSSQRGTLSAEFDLPGVYVLVCKVHPYMTAVVAVRDAAGAIPDVSAASLPFIGHLGVPALPATSVLGVMTTVAATDDDKIAKWDILGPADAVIPAVPGVGEVWIDTQFERVANQVDDHDALKPGTITIVDAATFTVEREINGLSAENGMWNNPHNMWASFDLSIVYNSNWFGRWINKIDRETGAILDSIEVGEAPTHIITIPTPGAQLGVLTIPLSADNDMAKVRDEGGTLTKIDENVTGQGAANPHGHWVTCGDGERTIVPNVFNGLGFGGSISIIDTDSGVVLAEFEHDPNDPLRSAIMMPVAVGECHVDGVNTAYVANIVTGMVTVVDVDRLCLVRNIPVTFTPDGQTGFDLLHTLQAPIQTPVSPDEKWVVTAVLSLTTVPRPPAGSADHLVVIDTHLNEVVAVVPAPAGVHGVNWGAKQGGGYYAYVANQHANVMTVLDPDPNGDGDGADAAAVGTILLANGSPDAGPTDGTGGQGIKPLPMTHDGWVQKAVALVDSGGVSPEVAGWISQLTPDQRDPSHEHVVIPGDINNDEVVDVSDLLATLEAWGPCPGDYVCDADIDCDLAVSITDLLIQLANWS